MEDGVMNNLGQQKPPAELDRELVERAIEVAYHHGITSADFIQMMESGITVSDFLNAMNVCTDTGYTIDCGLSWGNPPLLN
jgi:hypothetical protein